MVIWRWRRERGVTELGFSEHVYRFREALEVWRHPFWEENAQDGLEEYVDLRGVDEGKRPTREARHRDGLDPGAGRQHRGTAGSVAVGLRGRLGSFPGRRGRGPRRLRRLGLGRPGPGLEHLFRHARRCGGQRPVRHPRAPRPREGLGSRTPGAAAPAARVLRPRDRANRRRRTWRSRFRRPACGSRSGRSILRATCWRCSSSAGKPVALSSDAHEPENIGHRYDAAVALLQDVGSTGSVCSTAGPAARSRSDERLAPHGHRLRLPPLPGVGRPAGARGRGAPGRAGTRRALGRRCRVARARSTLCWGRRGSATSATISRIDDPRWANADSIELLGIVAGMLTDAGLAHGERRRDRDRRAAAARTR